MAMRRKYRRTKVSAAESAELWKRWKKGEGLHAIGEALGRGHTSIAGHIRPSGGIRPPPRRRSMRALSLAEREEISRGIVAGRSVRAMARALGRSASTVSREIIRNGGSRRYRAEAADNQAWRRALRPKPCKLALHAQLRQDVSRKLELNWSPEQIAGWLRRTWPEDEARRVSHETIYRSLYIQARGVLKQELMAHLRSDRRFRRSRHATQKRGRNGTIVDAVPISERPPSIEDRAVPGHWEGDLLCGSKNSFIVTLVERHSRYVMLAKVESRHTQTVINALIKQARKLPDELYKSLTWDRGHELADHKRFSMATNIDVYFCDPQSPWQRGSNENTNRLLRQYFPRQTDLAPHSQAHLNKVARQLNGRPRKTLDFQSPADRFSECVAAIG
jgi:IS30 family transposase